MQEINIKDCPYIFYDAENQKIQAYSELGSLVSAVKKPEGKESITDKVLALCEKERLEGGQDFKEIDGVNRGPQVKKYLNFVGLDEGNPWCAAFVSWILFQCNVKFFKTGDTWEIRRIAKEKGILSKVPQPGDVFLQLGSAGNPKHTGFTRKVDSLNPQYILTSEGNAGDGIRNCNDKLISECEFVHWQKFSE